MAGPASRLVSDCARRIAESIRDEVRKQLGPDATFEQRQEAAAAIMSDALWWHTDRNLREAITTADARELAEHWRLFYVAATRAEERLEIAGSLGPRSKGVPSENSWYAAAEAALAALGTSEREEGPRRSFAGHDPQPAVRLRPSRTAETRTGMS